MNIDAINKIGIYDKYGDDAPKFQKREEKKICKHKTQTKKSKKIEIIPKGR